MPNEPGGEVAARRTKRIYLYPGLAEGERYYLDRMGSVRDPAETALVLTEGMSVSFYDIDGSDKRERDDLLFEGKADLDAALGSGTPFIDWQSFRHESDEEA